MRHIRNPRYAPEFLEKKLSPSTVGVGAPVEFAAVSASTTSVSYVNYGDLYGVDDPPLPPPYDPPLSPTPFPPFEPPSLPPIDPLNPGLD